MRWWIWRGIAILVGCWGQEQAHRKWVVKERKMREKWHHKSQSHERKGKKIHGYTKLQKKKMKTFESVFLFLSITDKHYNIDITIIEKLHSVKHMDHSFAFSSYSHACQPVHFPLIRPMHYAFLFLFSFHYSLLCYIYHFHSPSTIISYHSPPPPSSTIILNYYPLLSRKIIIIK